MSHSPISKADKTQTLQKTSDTPLSPKQDFYQFYLSEHSNVNCRRLHFLGSSLGLLGLMNGIRRQSAAPVIRGIVAGYACAWVGHFVFEKNKPATFDYPLQSFISDWRMYADMWRGNISLRHHANN